jgi:allophanate hydrolase subunit 1
MNRAMRPIASSCTHGSQPGEIVHLHSETTFHVYMIGFVPGHPYMGDLPEWLASPASRSTRESFGWIDCNLRSVERHLPA